MIGTTIGHFRVLEQIGVGGMGVVYRAHDNVLDRDVALKVISPRAIVDDSARQRFRKEALSLARLSHPNIATVFEMGSQDGIDFIVTEYIRGVTLDIKLKTVRVLPEKETRELALQLLEGLDTAHQQGIVHRDLKPSNLCLTTQNRLKIIDFGLALLKQTSADSESTISITNPLEVRGTVPYMAPEQFRGEEADARTDLWAVGVVLYELITSQQPFTGSTGTALAADIIHKEPTWPRVVRPEISMGFESVIRKCMQKDRKTRYRSASDVIADLRQTSAGVPAPIAGHFTPGEQSVAVLPFKNLSPDVENEFLADGITEDIINALAQIKGLRVAARMSSFSFKHKSADLQGIANQLKVKALVEGSVRRSGNRIRIVAQLTSVEEEVTLWSERYDREISDVFQIQDEIARATADALRLSFALGEPLVKAGTKNLQSYEACAKGRVLLYRRGLALHQAVKSLEKAVSLDPQYALAWAVLAESYNLLGFNGLLEPNICRIRALNAAKRAVSLDPSSSEAHSALASARLIWELDLSSSESEYATSLSLDPRNVYARSIYAIWFFQWATNQMDEGVEQAEYAVQLDPLSAFSRSVLALTYLGAGQLEKGLKEARAAADQEPESFQSLNTLQAALLVCDQPKASIDLGESLLPVAGRHPWTLCVLAIAYANAARQDAAEGVYAELEARAKREYVQPTMLAACAWIVNKKEVANEHAGQAHLARDPLLLISRWHPLMRAIKPPGFVEMIGWHLPLS